MIDKIKEWLSTCNYLQPFFNSDKAKVEIERSCNRITSYEIYVTPTTPIVNQFLDGSCIRQQGIELRCFTNKLDKEVENLIHLENIVKWINASNLDLPENFTNVEALANGYTFSQTENEQKAIYLISINIEYLSEV